MSEKISPQILREARTRQRDERWLNSASTPTLRRYHGKYVAVKNRRILASSPTMKGLYEKLDKLNPGMVLITRIEKPSLLVYVEFH
ncbi:hypothetical protein E6H34_01720 [Candidatus Bathyarchaeota archaeon]|nr:MAG: hypothetical protein E6H34_01720 [Candidatus Bathyarchaeota archaeon]